MFNTEMSLEPIEAELKALTCTSCGSDIYLNEHYITLYDKLICDDLKCFANCLKKLDLDKEYILYALSCKQELFEYFSADIFEAMVSGDMKMTVSIDGKTQIIKGPEIFKFFASDNFFEFAQWYQEKIYSGEQHIYEEEG